MKSIFEIENRLDTTKEFSKLIEVFHENRQVVLVKEDYYTSTYRCNQYNCFLEMKI